MEVQDLGKAFREAVVARRQTHCRIRGEHIWVDRSPHYLCMNCKNLSKDPSTFLRNAGVLTKICSECWLMKFDINLSIYGNLTTSYLQMKRAPTMHSRVERGPKCIKCSTQRRDIEYLHKRTMEHIKERDCAVRLMTIDAGDFWVMSDDYKLVTVMCYEHGPITRPFRI